ncbi:MAG: hypothetical protein JXB30_14755 [Anaerolineae bacterium]|nr:hypothetical protein [Anaerolineae bacterium]
MHHPDVAKQQSKRTIPQITCASLAIAFLWWLGALPWSAYTGCGAGHHPTPLPETVRIGFYEEFPTAQRLEKLDQLDFPVRLAVAATSREEFLQVRESIEENHPQVQEVLFWPLLSLEEGYYPGTWSSAEGIERIANDANGLSTLWDMEWPRQGHWFPGDQPDNRAFLDRWLRERTAPVHIWRPHPYFGLDSRLLSSVGMHFDPRDYPMVYLHLDLYTTRQGLPDALLERVLRCGVEAYGEHFIPSFGVIDDGEGPEAQFIPVETLRRYLSAARRAGVSEVWLFGANGLNAKHIAVIKETLPVAILPNQATRGTSP